MISDEIYNDLFNFISFKEIELLQEITGFGEDEILSDYVLDCNLKNMTIDFKTWSNYKNEIEERGKNGEF
jgi:hypothetical protein